MSNFSQNPEKHNKPFIDQARDAARQFGEGFVVFVGSMAVLGTARKESAQDEARRWSVNNTGNVKIRRFRV